MILLPYLGAYAVAERIVLCLIRHLGHDGIAGGVVEHHYVVQSNGLRAHTLVLPLGPLDVALAASQPEVFGQGVLYQGQVKRCLWHARAVGHLVDHQIVAHQKALLQRGTGDVVVLEEVYVEEVNGYQGKYDGIYPAHDKSCRGVLQLLPPGPGNPSGDVGIDDERHHDKAPPCIHPAQEAQVECGDYYGLAPIHWGRFAFLQFHVGLVF